MKRKIVHIDEALCNGCGACAAACHEGAIAMVDGKAKLIRDDYCDGLGDCLPACPTGAITITEREALPYDEAAVLANQKNTEPSSCSCPGVQARTINPAGSVSSPADNVDKEIFASQETTADTERPSQLSQWPVQIKLLPLTAPYYQGKKLLIAADCTAYAYAGFHEKFIKGHVTLVGCPKLDAVNYADKLTEIFRNNDIQGITVVRMQVPCCGGLENAVKTALQNSGKNLPLDIVTISLDGKILD